MKDLLSTINTVFYGQGGDKTDSLLTEHSQQAMLERVKIYDINKILNESGTAMDIYDLTKAFAMVSGVENITNPKNAVDTINTSVRSFRMSTHLKETWQTMGKLLVQVANNYPSIDLTESLSKYTEEQVNLMEINLQLPWRFTFSEPTPIEDKEYPIKQDYDIWKGEQCETDPLEIRSQPSKMKPDSIKMTESINDIAKKIMEASDNAEMVLLSMLAAHDDEMKMSEMLRALGTMSRSDSSLRGVDWSSVVTDLEMGGNVTIVNNKVKLTPSGRRMIGESTNLEEEDVLPSKRSYTMESIIIAIHETVKYNKQKATHDTVWSVVQQMNREISNRDLTITRQEFDKMTKFMIAQKYIVNVGDSLRPEYMITKKGLSFWKMRDS
jgi:hypothetical protein